jgi:selenide,water dikinase
VYRLRDDLAVILTVDFFTPVVDDPRTFGEIAAANALSDVYAMGGDPFAALNICAFPACSDELPMEILGEILAGGCAKTAEAGVAIVGGHTVDDPEPKYGLAVIGRVHPERIVKKGGAKPGDRLVLTKPLGTGILTTALKGGRLGADDLAEAIRVMATLNHDAAEAMRAVGPTAGTDVTGFGLLGHLSEMLTASGVGARIRASEVPTLPGARDLAAENVAPGGSYRNLEAVATSLRSAEGVTDADRLLLADAQTSGGLLIAVEPGKAERLRRELAARGTPAAADIGEITAESGLAIDP